MKQLTFAPLLFLMPHVIGMPNVIGCGSLVFADEPAPSTAVLPGTELLTWPDEDLSTRMMDAAHQFVERKIADASESRDRHWSRSASSSEAYVESIQRNRQRFRHIIGLNDVRQPPAMERISTDDHPAVAYESTSYRITRVRWALLEHVNGHGLLIEPTGPVVAGAVIIPDAGESPEHLFANTDIRMLVENGIAIVIPTTVAREKLVTDDEQLRQSDQTYREWIYRQAFHMGRHVIGYEVQTALAAVDWLKSRHNCPVGIAGTREGGLTAMYAAAAETTCDVALISGYFGPRDRVWSEPIYRNVWSLLREFGDAEIASLVLPRALIVEPNRTAEVSDHKGSWASPELGEVEREWNRLTGLIASDAPDQQVPASLMASSRLLPASPVLFGRDSLRAFAAALGVQLVRPATLDVQLQLADLNVDRHTRYVAELEGHVQQLVERSEHVRDDAFLFKVLPELNARRWSTEHEHPTLPPETFATRAAEFRDRFRTEAIGQFDEPLQPVFARTRVVKETDTWTAYDVVLPVTQEFFAWGILVVPKDIAAGERRPVVVCQHGRNGIPRNLLDGDKSGYRNVAAQLAERGFVTFAPHNLYRGEDRYRWLDRKANTIGCTLFSFILASHDQITRWLAGLPFVDGDRIGFYGLSYGGETAVRIPPLLDRYALSICSGDFNQWTRKVASTHEPFSFMRTIEWEMPYWNWGHTFDYAEMSYLMVPRPFMVERGHNDLVGRDQWVAHEYAKVAWLYAQLGLADRTEISFFQGGHAMRLEATVEFLHRHLNWRDPTDRP